MDPDQIRDFLMHSTRTAKVATASAAGVPHVVPVWFVVDGDDLVFTTASGSVKARHLTARPQLSVCVDDEAPPFAFVSLSGTARLARRPPDLVGWTTRIARRYVGAGAAEEVGLRYAAFDDLLVRFRPERVVAQAEITA